jgi:hypothetical protein
MKKLITLSLLLAASTISGWAQGVGIGISDPKETLHIGESNGTIRVESLNSANNPKNSGGANMYNLLVDADGNLTLGEDSGELVSEASFSSPSVVQTGADASINSNELYKKNFTLTQRAFVVVTYYISMEFDNYDGTAKIVDGGAKVAHNYWYLGNGIVPDTSKTYGMQSTVYSNADCDTASGFIYNSRSVTLPLEAGTYSIHLNGAADGGGQIADAAFRVTFGDMDRLDINVIYL